MRRHSCQKREGPLAQLIRLFRGNQLEVDFRADAGLHGCVNQSVGVDFDFIDYSVFLRRIRQEDFEVLTVLDKSEGNIASIELKATKKILKITRNTVKFNFNEKNIP